MEEKDEIAKDVTEVVPLLKSFLVIFTSSSFSINGLILLSSQCSLLETPLWYISTKLLKVVLPKLQPKWRWWNHARVSKTGIYPSIPWSRFFLGLMFLLVSSAYIVHHSYLNWKILNLHNFLSELLICRIAYSMIKDAEDKGLITPGKVGELLYNIIPMYFTDFDLMIK